jgi:hypothetical protein
MQKDFHLFNVQGWAMTARRVPPLIYRILNPEYLPRYEFYHFHDGVRRTGDPPTKVIAEPEKTDSDRDDAKFHFNNITAVVKKVHSRYASLSLDA